jgi:glycine/D-amino acid oxidase-like deaminating enzyme
MAPAEPAAALPVHDVIMIGAGIIIGLATAHKLKKAGRAVTLPDPNGITNRASVGNAPAFAFPDIQHDLHRRPGPLRVRLLRRLDRYRGTFHEDHRAQRLADRLATTRRPL